MVFLHAVPAYCSTQGTDISCVLTDLYRYPKRTIDLWILNNAIAADVLSAKDRYKISP